MRSGVLAFSEQVAARRQKFAKLKRQCIAVIFSAEKAASPFQMPGRTVHLPPRSLPHE
jgi:hypothetical protein